VNSKTLGSLATITRLPSITLDPTMVVSKRIDLFFTSNLSVTGLRMPNNSMMKRGEPTTSHAPVFRQSAQVS
jgi:hypothetical protein